jgi:effector-binding domain-containing protein
MKKIIYLLVFPCLVASFRAQDMSIAVGLSRAAVRDTIQRPAISIEETSIKSMMLVVIKDTAANGNPFSKLFAKDYPEIYSFISRNGLKAGKLVTIYYNHQFPMILEVGVEVDNFPGRTEGRIRINKVPEGPAVIAHFKGPYRQLSLAYEAINKWLKDHNRVAYIHPFEVYLNNPGSVKDSFDLRTDVYQLLRER